MQENHRNGQDDSDVGEPFTITRAALNRQIISSGSLTGSNEGQRINREVISQPVLVVQKVL